jgi:hypothetical protein
MKTSKANCINRVYEAGDGNRTHVRSLGISNLIISDLWRAYCTFLRRRDHHIDYLDMQDMNT